MSRGKEGYVYILTNPSMPGLVKVGRTSRCPYGRAEELHTTGVPTPFHVHFSVYTPFSEATEEAMHILLDNERVSSSREFFRVDPEKAKGLLTEVHLEDLWRLFEVYLDGLDVEDIRALADKRGAKE